MIYYMSMYCDMLELSRAVAYNMRILKPFINGKWGCFCG